MQTNKKLFGVHEIFVSLHAKHETTYMVDMKKNIIKTRTTQFSVLIDVLCLTYNICSVSNCSYILCT